MYMYMYVSLHNKYLLLCSKLVYFFCLCFDFVWRLVVGKMSFLLQFFASNTSAFRKLNVTGIFEYHFVLTCLYCSGVVYWVWVFFPSLPLQQTYIHT